MDSQSFALHNPNHQSESPVRIGIPNRQTAPAIQAELSVDLLPQKC
jgi:hypothetical protein